MKLVIIVASQDAVLYAYEASHCEVAQVVITMQ